MSSQYDIKKRLERRKEGKCWHCNSLATNGKAHCEYHLEKGRAAARRSQKKKVCPRCNGSMLAKSKLCKKCNASLLWAKYYNR